MLRTASAGLSFKALRAGKTAAIVGATGAGKSTIVSLINRLYEIERGQILVDDNDIPRPIRGIQPSAGIR